MAKGGRYLNTNKARQGAPAKKKGKGAKAAVIVVLVLALLIGGGYFGVRMFAGSMLSNVNRAEFEEKNADKSFDDLMAEIYGDVEAEMASGEEEGESDPQPTETQPQETAEAPAEG